MNISNVEAERAVLGAVMQAPHLIDEIAEVISGPDFSQPKHEQVWEAVLDIHLAAGRPDPLVVMQKLGTNSPVDMPYLIALTGVDVIPSPAQAPYFASLIRDAAIAHRVSRAATMIHDSVTEATDVESLTEDARKTLEEALTGTIQTDEGIDASDLLMQVLDDLEKEHDPGLSTGWSDLDHYVNGLRPGQLAIVGARPSVGKSVIAANIAAAVCRAGSGVHFASLEMTRNEVMYRMLAARAMVELGSLMNHTVSDAGWQKIAPLVTEISNWPLRVDDQPSQTLAQLRGRAKGTARRRGLGLIVVDYLQLMAPRDRRVPREQQVGELSEGLKGLAKELEVPVVALAQVNRGSADRSDKRPVMSDLRESGRIEADADHIWLLHRQDLVDPNSTTGEIEVIVAKNRNGVAGSTVRLAFQGHYSRAVPMAPAYRQIA